MRDASHPQPVGKSKGDISSHQVEKVPDSPAGSGGNKQTGQMCVELQKGISYPAGVSEGGQYLLWCCGQWHPLDYNHTCKSMESVKTAVSWGEGGSVPVSVCGILSGQ